MEEGLNLNFILDSDEIDLFNEDIDGHEHTKSEDNKEEEEKKEEKTTEVNPEELFSEEPKSVGSKEDNEGKEDTLSKEESGTSPEIFSSIATAFAEEGILPNLDEEAAKGIKSAEDFKKVIEDYLKSELDEQQQRIKEALDNGLEPDTIRQYENTINYLDNINEDSISSENEQGDNLRKQLIYQDYINRGFSQKRATKEVDRAISNGTDIEDAKEALASLKEFYTEKYNDTIKEAKALSEKEESDRKKQTEALKASILDTNNEVFKGLEVDKNTRQKVLNNISKPVYRDPDTGTYLNAIQKYAKEHNDDFTLKLGFLFTLTDGFKTLDGLIKNQTKKAVKKGFKDLEQKLRNTPVKGGALSYTSGVSEDNIFIKDGVKLL